MTNSFKNSADGYPFVILAPPALPTRTAFAQTIPFADLGEGAFMCSFVEFTRREPQAAQNYLHNAVETALDCTSQSVIFIPAHAHMSDPIIVSQQCTDFSNTHLIVIAQEHSYAQITFTGDAQLHNSVAYSSAKFFLQDSAQLHCTIMHDQNYRYQERAFTFNLQRNSSLDCFIALMGGMHNKFNFTFALHGADAQATLKGLCVMSADNKSVITSKQNHLAPRTKSSVMIKGGLHDQAQLFYGGTITITEDAAQSDAEQYNKNMLRSPKARATAIPCLEVSTHDVQCRHGSAVGTVNEEELFYLQARGITPKAAHELLMIGFFADLTKNLARATQDKLLSAIRARL